MRRCVQLVAVLLLLIGAAPAFAVQPDEMLSDPALEARARTLSRELRCMVCQNQSIDDSEAPLARDLRLLVRERLKAGDSDKEVLRFLVARYGEFVLLKPPLGWNTALLWFVPMGVLLIGGCGLVVMLRRRRLSDIAEADALVLTEAERARLSEVLTENRDPTGSRS